MPFVHYAWTALWKCAKHRMRPRVEVSEMPDRSMIPQVQQLQTVLRRELDPSRKLYDMDPPNRNVYRNYDCALVAGADFAAADKCVRASSKTL